MKPLNKNVSFYENLDDKNKAKERSIKDKSAKYKYRTTEQGNSPVKKYIPSPEGADFHSYLDEAREHVRELMRRINNPEDRHNIRVDVYTMKQLGHHALLSEESVDFSESLIMDDTAIGPAPLKRIKTERSLPDIIETKHEDDDLEELADFLFCDNGNTIFEEDEVSPNDASLKRKWDVLFQGSDTRADMVSSSREKSTKTFCK